MSLDAHKNFAISTVATAPSPATSGTSLVVASGQGSRFPAAPFNATIWPASTQPDPSNAEIVRVTAISTDTLTITRTQEGTTARTVIVGDQIMAGITVRSFTDIEAITRSALMASFATYESIPRFDRLADVTVLTSGRLQLVAIALPSGFVVNNISFVTGTNGVGTPTNWWFGLYDSSLVQLAVTADQTSTAWGANTVKTLPIATIASGASSTFTTTYSGLHYLGVMCKATSAGQMIAMSNQTSASNLTPLLAGHSDASQTTPPSFPHTATAIVADTSVMYATVA